MARAVTVIPATASRISPITKTKVEKKRVAAYARVSTDNDEQLQSFEAQMDYYTKHIKSNPDWVFVNVYTDEGISATSTKKRDGFNRMIEDALSGKIDLIITKSVSRFARNTVDTLTTVRKLIRSSLLEDVEKINFTLNIYSMWEGYLENEKYKKFKSYCDEKGIPFKIIHTSGHISKTELKEFIEKVGAEKTFIIHANSEIAKIDFPNVIYPENGFSIEI